MAFQSPDLKSIPLFAHIPDAHLAQLVGAFERVTLAKGDTLFTEGAVADRFVLLVEGEIEVRSGDERIAVRPFAPVGELAALAGLPRASTAIAAERCQLLSLPSARLFSFFQDNGDIGFRFHDNLVHILADKLERDRRHLDEVRANIVETQKAMKRMRDALLEADDTPLHRTMFEELDAHIEHNRRGRYLVAVPRALPIRLRIEGDLPVLHLSNEKLIVQTTAATPLTAGSAFAGVLVAPESEIPLSGTVDQVGDGSAELTLDLLIDDSAQQLERILARLQLLDVVL